jgi:ubiquinone/menaquinone biosynthesis C-methylase UbiE
VGASKEVAMARIDWDALSRVFDVFSSEEYTPILHQFYPWMVDQLDERDLEPEVIVDVGCGTALLSSRLVEWYPDAALILVDDNPAMLRVARDRLGEAPGVSIVEATAHQALESLAPQSVEMMIFCRSWYALPEPARLAARAVEALAPDGLAFLFDFTQAPDLEKLDAFYAELEPERWPLCRAVMVDFDEGIAEGRYRLYSQAEITAQWRDAGAELVAFESHEPDFPNQRMCFARS